jgi:hypothetical protein
MAKRYWGIEVLRYWRGSRNANPPSRTAGFNTSIPQYLNTLR